MNGHIPQRKKFKVKRLPNGMGKRSLSTKGTLRSEKFNAYTSWDTWNMKWRKKDLKKDPYNSQPPEYPKIGPRSLRESYSTRPNKKGGKKGNLARAFRTARAERFKQNYDEDIEPEQAESPQIKRVYSSQGFFQADLERLSSPKSAALTGLDGMLKDMKVLENSGRFTRLNLRRSNVK